jgi:hypothetical protein
MPSIEAKAPHAAKEPLWGGGELYFVSGGLVGEVRVLEIR